MAAMGSLALDQQGRLSAGPAAGEPRAIGTKEVPACSLLCEHQEPFRSKAQDRRVDPALSSSDSSPRESHASSPLSGPGPGTDTGPEKEPSGGQAWLCRLLSLPPGNYGSSVYRSK